MSHGPQAAFNPYPGLRPFEAEENHLFFGRDGQSNQLLRRLRENRFLAVVGASGSGKSSLVRAGLLPDLQGGLMAGTGSGWRIAVLRPGGDPVGNLARALNESDTRREEAVGDGDPAMELAFTRITLERSALGITEAVRQFGSPAGEKFLVVVDQFEELFRFKESASSQHAADQAGAFVKLLLNAAQEPASPVYVILTMRSDFLGDCAQFPDLPEAISDSQYLVPRMSRDERRQAIVGPAAVAHVSLSPRLQQRLLNDVGDDPDQLPILQHALMRTFEHWREKAGEGESIDLAHYQAIGGMEAALSLHADEAYEELGREGPPERAEHLQRLAERLFRSLTEKGPDNREVRRPGRLGELAEAAGTSVEELTEIVEVFRRPGRSFLMPPVGEPLDAESVLDISHESLIRNWKRLATWVAQESRSAAIYLRLADRAERWGKQEAGYLKNPELQLALDWRRDNAPNGEWAKRYHPAFDRVMKLLDESRDKDVAERAAAARRRKLTVLFLGAFVAFLVVALGLSLWQQAQIRRQEEIASLNLARVFEEKAGFELAAAAEAWRDSGAESESSYQKAWLYTLRALKEDIGEERLAVSLGRLLLPEIYPQGLFSVSERHTGAVLGLVHTVSFGPDGSVVAYATSEGTGLWYPERGEATIRVGEAGMGTWDVAFSADGARLATASSDGAVRLWRIADGALLREYRASGGDIWCVALHPGGRWLAAAASDGVIRVWDVESAGGPAVEQPGHRGKVRDLSFSSDGSVLASASSDTTLRLWKVDPGSGRLTAARAPLVGHEGEIWDVSFSADGRWLASASGDKTVRVWDLDPNAEANVKVLRGHTGDVWSVDFSPDGLLLASASDDQRVLLWDPRLPAAPLASVSAHREDILSVDFSPDGRRLVSGSADSVLRLTDFVVTRKGDQQAWDLRSLIREPYRPGYAAAITRIFDESLEALRYRLDEGSLTLVRLEEPAASDTTEVLPGSEEVPALPFDAENWTFHGTSNPGYPVVSRTAAELIPDDRAGAAQVVLYRKNVEAPFDIEFEYAIEHAGLGRGDYSGAAEGLVLFFFMDNQVYDSVRVPGGDSRGYATAGGGYSLHFEVYGERMIEFRDPDGRELADYRFDRRKSIPDVYTGGDWRPVRVMVKRSGLSVYYDGLELIHWEGDWESSGHLGLGFGAASGTQATARHALRDVRLATEYRLALRKEREAFQLLIDGKFAEAQAAFEETEELYATFHQVYEIARLIERQQADIRTPEDRRRIYREVVDNLSWKAPEDLLEQLRELAEAPANPGRMGGTNGEGILPGGGR